MKKIFILFTFLSVNSFAETQLLTAPFAEATVESTLASTGRLVIPPMVAEAVYREAVTEDCRQYRETVSKYSAQLNQGELTALVSAPLPYSMKKSFEAELAFALPKSVDLKEDGELIPHFDVQSLSLDWSEIDLLKEVLNPMDSISLNESSSVVRIKFTRRDIFCGYLNDKLKLKMGSTVYWKLSNEKQSESDINLKLLTQELTPVLNLEKGDKLLAALAGRTIHLVSRRADFQADPKFKTVEYIWSLLFESEKSMLKTAIWTHSPNGVYLQEKPMTLEMAGLQ